MRWQIGVAIVLGVIAVAQVLFILYQNRKLRKLKNE